MIRLLQKQNDLDLHYFSRYICLNILNKFGNHINIVVHRLTLCLRVSSADTFANRFDPDQATHKVGPDLDSNCLALRWYS